MTKEETTQLKGIAILLMLWLHLFSNYEAVTEQCITYINFWNGQPLAFVMKKWGNLCVSLYVMLGGYGLGKCYQRAVENVSSMNNARRFIALYANFWIVFLLALPLGCWLQPALFCDTYNMLTNFLALNNSFNGAWWFLLPYAVLTLIAQPFMKFLYALKGKGIACTIVIFTILHVISYVMLERIDTDDLLSLFTINILRLAGLLLLFSAGAWYARYGIVERFRLPRTEWAKWGLLIVLALLKLAVGASSLINIPFILIFIPLFCRMKKGKTFTAAMTFMGRHSTNMWLVHYFFISYIADGEIYQLKYPLLIYSALIITTLMVSEVIGIINKPIQAKIRKA